MFYLRVFTDFIFSYCWNTSVSLSEVNHQLNSYPYAYCQASQAEINQLITNRFSFVAILEMWRMFRHFLIVMN